MSFRRSSYSPSYLRRWLFAVTFSIGFVANPFLSQAQSPSLPTRPVARILKVWNQSVTPKDVFRQIKPYVSLEWQQWFINSHRQISSLQTSIDFVGNDQFFLRTPGIMVLVNTSEIHEGRLMIHRRPFTFSQDENLRNIAQRLQKIRLNQQFQFQTWKHFLWQHFVPSIEAATDQSSLVAPLLAVIDNERSQSHCESHLAAVSAIPSSKNSTAKARRNIASLEPTPIQKQPAEGLTDECRSLVADILQRQKNRPDHVRLQVGTQPQRPARSAAGLE